MPATLRVWGLLLLATSLSACPTREDPVVYADAGYLDSWVDPNIPTIAAGTGSRSCASSAVIDLNALGVRHGRITKLRVDTRGRSNDLQPSCQTGTDSVEAVFRYRVPEGAQAAYVSTDAPATEFDTVLYARSNCHPEAGDISCNDDIADRNSRSTIYVTELQRGEILFLVVDGRDGQRGLAELTVMDLPQGTLGNPCRLQPNDSPEGLRAPSRCDLPARCAPGAAPDGTGLCVTVVPVGSACDPEGSLDVCVDGASCAVDPMDGTAAMCSLPGNAPGAPCRSTAPRCNTGLDCSRQQQPTDPQVCVRLVGTGADCDPAGTTNRCAPPGACVDFSGDAGLFRCR